MRRALENIIAGFLLTNRDLLSGRRAFDARAFEQRETKKLMMLNSKPSFEEKINKWFSRFQTFQEIFFINHF